MYLQLVCFLAAAMLILSVLVVLDAVRVWVKILRTAPTMAGDAELVEQQIG